MYKPELIKKEILRMTGSPTWVLTNIDKMVEQAFEMMEKKEFRDVSHLAYCVIDKYY